MTTEIAAAIAVAEAEARFHRSQAKSEKWRQQARNDRESLSLAQRELLRARHPVEPVTGSVIKFRKQYDKFGGRIYEYAAIKGTDGRWYCTGLTTPNGVDWYGLVTFIKLDNKLDIPASTYTPLGI